MCHFEGDNCWCKILSEEKCTNPKKCKFRKTSKEYYSTQEEAKEILRKKGLEVVIRNGVVTTRRI